MNISLRIQAHSTLPIFQTVQLNQEDLIGLPQLHSRVDITFRKKYILSFVAGKIKPRDGHLAIYSSPEFRITLKDSESRRVVDSIWQSFGDSEILILPCI